MEFKIVGCICFALLSFLGSSFCNEYFPDLSPSVAFLVAGQSVDDERLSDLPDTDNYPDEDDDESPPEHIDEKGSDEYGGADDDSVYVYGTDDEVPGPNNIEDERDIEDDEDGNGDDGWGREDDENDQDEKDQGAALDDDDEDNGSDDELDFEGSFEDNDDEEEDKYNEEGKYDDDEVNKPVEEPDYDDDEKDSENYLAETTISHPSEHSPDKGHPNFHPPVRPAPGTRPKYTNPKRRKSKRPKHGPESSKSTRNHRPLYAGTPPPIYIRTLRPIRYATYKTYWNDIKRNIPTGKCDKNLTVSMAKKCSWGHKIKSTDKRKYDKYTFCCATRDYLRCVPGTLGDSNCTIDKDEQILLGILTGGMSTLSCDVYLECTTGDKPNSSPRLPRLKILFLLIIYSRKFQNLFLH